MNRTILSLVALFFTAGHGAQAQKKRVAVLDFDYTTVKSNVAALFGTDQDIGKGVANVLIDRLVNDGTYSVIERQQLDRIMAEQNFSNSDRAKSSTAAKIGRILGVDAIIAGSITQFGAERSTTSTGGGVLGAVTGHFGIAGAEKTKTTAIVQITARMIDTSTAEVLASCQGEGRSSRGGVGLLGQGGNVYGPAAGGNIDMKSSGFRNTLLGEATNRAVTDAAGALEAKAASLPVAVISINGLVADASDLRAVIINVGSRNGLTAGAVLQVKRPGQVVRDPATGKAIRTMADRVGTLTIVEVDASSAVGKFTGTGRPQVKDVVTSK